MDKLLESRKHKNDAPQKVENLSPQKYGKNAYYQLTYTPSKLADNVIFKQVSTLKKIEQQSCKTRGFEAQSSLLTDQVDYLKKERDGIKESLNHQINVYKGIIEEMETKNQDRVNNMQKKFNEEMQKVIADKQEESKFFQSQKEILQERIIELETDLTTTKQDVKNLEVKFAQNLNSLQQQKEKAQLLEDKVKLIEEKAKEDAEKGKSELEDLKKQFMMAEVEWKNTLNEEIHKKNVQISKLEQILDLKDRTIDSLTSEVNKQKVRNLSLSQDFQKEISYLAAEKNRILDEMEFMSKDTELLSRDRKAIVSSLQKENFSLRELLMESSNELEKCKNEFVGLDKENIQLIARLKSSEEEAKTWRDSYYLNKSRNY